jgi:hypothetical protein
MSITLLSLQERVARALRGYDSCSATADGSTDFTTFVSTELAEQRDEYFRDRFIKITASTDSGVTLETRKIRNKENPSGTVHPYRAFTTQITSGSSASIFKYDPSQLTYFINEAVRQSLPFITTPIVDDTLITDNLLPNASFEEGSTTPTLWSSSLATVARSSTHIHGSYSTSLGTAAGKIYIGSDTQPEFLRLAGTNPVLYGWVKTAAANNARLAISYTTVGGDTTTTYSDYHSGDNEWEMLEVDDVSVPDITTPTASTDLADIQIWCCTATTTTAYFDNLFLPITNTEYLMPASLTKVVRAYSCNDWDTHGITSRYDIAVDQYEDNGTQYLTFPNGFPASGKKIELHGSLNFSDLSSDSDTLAIPKEWEAVIVNGACAGFLYSIVSALSGEDKKNILIDAQRFEKAYEQGKILKQVVSTSHKLRKVV